MMQEIKKLLIVEDNLPDSILLQEYLSKIPFVHAEIIVAERMGQVLKLDAHKSPDLIFLDLNLPDSNGIDTFITVGKHFPNATIIVLSGLEDMEVALQAIQSGADDYLVKGELDEKILAKAISYSIERKRIQVKLKESEEMYRSLLENATEALIVMDIKENRFLNVSKTACSLFGISEEELLHLQPDDLMPPLQPDGSSSAQGVLAKLNATMNGENPFFEWTFSNKNGDEIPCEVRLVKLPSEDKLLIRGSIIDISERKKAEEEILLSNARFQMISKATSDIVWDWDLVNDKGWYNDNYYKILDVEKSISSFDMTHWYKKIHPSDLARVQANIAAVLEGTDDTWRDEYRFMRSDGEYLHFLDRGFIIRDKNGKAIRMIGSMVDMTPIYSAQNEVRESENRLRTILETNPECIKLLDKDWRTLEINSGGLTMVEAETSEQVLNHCLLPMMNESYRARAIQLINDAFNGKQGRLEFEMVTLKNNKRWAEITMVPFRNSKGDIIHALGVTRDITKRKEAEKELAASYKAIRELTGHLQNIREEERTNIAREIHDELGQQLTVLKMDASWLKKKVGDTSTVVGNKIEELISMLDDTVKSVRRISSELRPSLLDDLGLIAAIEWQLGEFEKRSGIATYCIHKEEELDIPDKAKTTLFRIFQESLTNVARHSQANKVTVSINEVDDNIVLSIEDNGKGFDKQKIAEKRTLGILGMKERTAMIAGAYDITSIPGKGTRVAVKIPCSKN